MPSQTGFLNSRRVGISTGEDRINGLDSLPFTYIPSLYEVEYDGVGIKSFSPKEGVNGRAKEKVVATKNLDLDKFEIPRSFIYTPGHRF